MAKVNKCLKIFGIILCMVLVNSFPIADFGHEVKEWMNLYEDSQFCNYTEKCGGQLFAALQTANKIAKDRHTVAAVAIVYIFTTESPNTYKLVNDLMRGDYHGKPSDKIMFQIYVELLKQSHDYLCENYERHCKYYPVVYRGQTFIPSSFTFPYAFKSFVSTSTVMESAQHFAKGELIFTIKEVKGLYVFFSASPEEEEILIKPPIEIDIDIFLNSQEQIIKPLIKKHNGSLDEKLIPKVYVEGRYKKTQPKVYSSHVNKG